MMIASCLSPSLSPSRSAFYEVQHIQDHLIGAEALLATSSHAEADRALDHVRQLTRILLTQELAGYRMRGAFPKNRDFPDERRPYFIDAEGTRCAMAYLMELGGAADLVNEVATTNNNAYVEELAHDPRFLAWLDAAGLTVAEAARIQPMYGCAAPTECLCGSTQPVMADRAEGADTPHFVWEGTVVQLATNNTMAVRVDAVYSGDDHATLTPPTLGATIDVEITGRARDGQALLVGTKLLGLGELAWSHDTTSTSPPTALPTTAMRYEAVTTISESRQIDPACLRRGIGDVAAVGTVSRLKVEDARAIMLRPTNECVAELAKLDSCWTRASRVCDGCTPQEPNPSPATTNAGSAAASDDGCNLSGSTSSVTPGSVTVLLAIVGALAVRNRLRRA